MEKQKMQGLEEQKAGSGSAQNEEGSQTIRSHIESQIAARQARMLLSSSGSASEALTRIRRRG